MDIVILVTGARDWNDEQLIYEKLKEFVSRKVLIIHGCCQGVDMISDKVGKNLGFDILAKPAEWSHYGRAAGPIRNKEMINEVLKYKNLGVETIVYAFHDNVDKSRGTKNCVNQATKMGLKVVIFSH